MDMRYEFVPVGISQALVEYTSLVGELADAKMVASMGSCAGDFQRAHEAEVAVMAAKKELESVIVQSLNQAMFNGQVHSCKCGGGCAA